MRTIVCCLLVCLLGFSCEKDEGLDPETIILLDRLFSESGEDHDFTFCYEALTPGDNSSSRTLIFATEDILVNDTLRGVTDVIEVNIGDTEDDRNNANTDLTQGTIVVTFHEQLQLATNSTEESFVEFEQGGVTYQEGNSGATTFILQPPATLSAYNGFFFRWSGIPQPANTLY